MNKNYLINDGVISIVDFCTKNNSGKYVINAQNTYLIKIVQKAMNLQSIGCNFVVNRQYKDDSIILNNHSVVMSSKYDKNSNSIDDKKLVNLCNMVNLFLDDRQILARYNDKENLILTVVSYDAKLENYYIREKNSSIVQVVKTFDLVENRIVESEEKTCKGKRLLNDSDTSTIWTKLQAIDNVIKDFTQSFKTLPKQDKKAKNA